MAYTTFDPSQATKLAKFQGTMAGMQAGNSTVTGVAMAPTSIYNQAGYYALQDTDTGYVTLQKGHNDSLYTKSWYDQGTGTIFDFTDGGLGAVDAESYFSNNNSTANKKIPWLNNYPNGNGYQINNNEKYNRVPAEDIPAEDYYPEINNENKTGITGADSSNETETSQENENSKGIKLTAKDIEELVDNGLYSTLQEALYSSLAAGYSVSDEEQAKLDIFTDDSEKKIQLVMEKYGMNRNDAIMSLGENLSFKDGGSDIENMKNKLMEYGFTSKEAVDYMEQLGYSVPEELKKEEVTYLKKDEKRITKLMAATGCTRDEAIESIGCKKPSGFSKFIDDIFG